MKTIVYTALENNCPQDQKYVCYIILPNGEYWGVRFNGATEEIARTKALATWNKEQEKWKKLEQNICDDAKTIMNAVIVDPWSGIAVGSGHHSANKVWMRHATEGLKRISLTEIGLYEDNGWYRSGPRGK